ncbi:MAG: hypothetical protein ACU0BS_12225 [Hasllibacter sp.]
MPPPPVFLERRRYRRRRLRDAVRMLPALALVLIVLPTFWPAAPEGALAGRALTLFAGWALLIVAAAGLSRALAAPPPEGEE